MPPMRTGTAIAVDPAALDGDALTDLAARACAAAALEIAATTVPSASASAGGQAPSTRRAWSARPSQWPKTMMSRGARPARRYPSEVTESHVVPDAGPSARDSSVRTTPSTCSTSSGVDRGRQLQLGIGPGRRGEDLLDGGPRDRVRAHRAGDHGRRRDDDGQPRGRHQDAIVTDAGHDQAEPAAPAPPSTRPHTSPPGRSVAPSSGSGCRSGVRPRDVAGRRARCVVAL